MFFTLTFPNKVHGETKSRKPKVIFLCLPVESSSTWNVGIGHALGAPSVPLPLGVLPGLGASVPAQQGVPVSTLQRKGQNLGGVLEVSMDAPVSLQPGHDNGCLQNRNPPNIPTLHKTPSRNVCSCHFFLPSILPFQSALICPPCSGPSSTAGWSGSPSPSYLPRPTSAWWALPPWKLPTSEYLLLVLSALLRAPRPSS